MALDTTRRSFLKGLIALGALRAVAKLESIIPDPVIYPGEIGQYQSIRIIECPNEIWNPAPWFEFELSNRFVMPAKYDELSTAFSALCRKHY